LANEFFVVLGFLTAQAVIEMNDREYDSQFRAEFQQNSQHRDGISATRNGDADTVSRAEKILFANIA